MKILCKATAAPWPPLPVAGDGSADGPRPRLMPPRPVNEEHRGKPVSRPGPASTRVMRAGNAPDHSCLQREPFTKTLPAMIEAGRKRRRGDEWVNQAQPSQWWQAHFAITRLRSDRFSAIIRVNRAAISSANPYLVRRHFYTWSDAARV